MIKSILRNLWFWVIGAFFLIILAWYFTILVASKVHNPPLEEGEVLERQPPTKVQ